MSLRKNGNVDKLAAYLPLDADTSQLFQEYVEPTSEVISTVAFDYLREVIGRPASRLVVLTGDAGHGKTHLCFRLLVDQGVDEKTAQEMILNQADGSADHGTVGGGKVLRLIKDLSDFTAEDAAALLDSALAAEGRVTVVCANEGRLRRAIQERVTTLGVLRETLEDGTRLGKITNDHVSYVINLNFQSVAANGGSGIAKQLLKSWVQDQRRWRACSSCDARDVCPIYENHRTLGSASESEDRRHRFVGLLRLVERCATVVTIRELFIVTSLAITGGLRCEDVHRRYERSHRGRDWQHPHLYHQALFGESIGERERDRVRLLRGLRQIDPARVAIRSVDDELAAIEGDREGFFLPPLPSVDQASARTRNQFQRDAVSQRRLMGFLRRRALFNDAADGDDLRGIGARTGLRHAALFEAAVDGNLDEKQTVALRDDLVSGLEAIQGVRRPPQANLFIIDPAFTSHRSSASVVAQQLPASRIDFISQSSFWVGQDGPTAELKAALDWSDRSVFLSLTQGPDELPVTLELDMLRFELVLRYAEGLTAREHFHADLRRITSRLARLATATDSSEITVLVGGERRRISIDVGNRVRAVDA